MFSIWAAKAKNSISNVISQLIAYADTETYQLSVKWQIKMPVKFWDAFDIISFNINLTHSVSKVSSNFQQGEQGKLTKYHAPTQGIKINLI